MTPEPVDAVSVALLAGDRFLLVRRGHAPSKGLLAFPGGRVDQGEEIEAAARRELLEETGLACGTIALHDVMLLPGPDGHHGYRLHVFSGTAESCLAVTAADDAESAGWFTIDEMEAGQSTDSTLRVARTLLRAREAG